MKQNDIDRILAVEDEITPSPRFLASVMAAVEREAATLPPLEFPWIRALPGFLATIVAIAAAIRHGIGVMSDPAVVTVLNEHIRQISALSAGIGLQWIALAFAITIISVLLSSILVRGSNYA